MIQVQATIVGYGGRPCSLFSAYHPESRVLVIGAEAKYIPERRAGCLVVTNDRAAEWDKFYSDDDLSCAIRAFYSLKHGVAVDGKSSRIVFDEMAARANPEHSIERDGYDPSGPRYRISEGVTCAHIAALATCIYAVAADAVEDAVAMSESLRRLSLGGVITI